MHYSQLTPKLTFNETNTRVEVFNKEVHLSTLVLNKKSLQFTISSPLNRTEIHGKFDNDNQFHMGFIRSYLQNISQGNL